MRTGAAEGPIAAIEATTEAATGAATEETTEVATGAEEAKTVKRAAEIMALSCAS